MDGNLDAQRQALDALARELASALAATTGDDIQYRLGAPVEAPLRDLLSWKQEFAPSTAGAAWLLADRADAARLGRRMLEAAGIQVAPGDDTSATYLDMVAHAFSSFARASEQAIGAMVSCASGREQPSPGGPFVPVDLLCCGEVQIRLFSRLEGMAARSDAAQEPACADISAGPPSRTLDLLLDVQMPVSVSFGSAQLPLKEVVKLTTGSIIELNRTLGDPVELIVNDCVIARGEVVVVDGNFGIRVQEVVSRQERLRTVR